MLAGHTLEAERALELSRAATVEALAPMPKDDKSHDVWPVSDEVLSAEISLMSGKTERAFVLADTAARTLRAIEVPDAERVNSNIRREVLKWALVVAADAAIGTGRYGEAETLLREYLAAPATTWSLRDPAVSTAAVSVTLAHALSSQGRSREALELLEPELQRYRAERAQGASDVDFQHDFAYALYVSALLTDAPRERNALLQEAEQLLRELSQEAQDLFTVRRLKGRIAAAQV
jgi:hypothetical protein